MQGLISSTQGFFKKTMIAAAVTVTLAGASIATTEPALAFGHGGGGFHHFGGHGGFGHGGWHGGFRHGGFGHGGWRGGRFGYGGFGHRGYGYGFRRFGYYGGYGGCLRRVWGPYGWHFRRFC